MKKTLGKDFIVLDGAMGTMLMQHGLDVGKGSEIYNLTHPHIIKEIHTEYLKSGSDIVYSNTFGINKFKNIEGYQEQITQGVKLAKEAAAEFGALVALDVGPLGALLKPLGTLSFDEAYDAFKDKMTIGEQAGVDLIVVETMTDLYEMKAALLAAKENTSLPIFATMSFEKNMKTFTGTDVKAFAVTAQDLGADAVGINCSLGPYEILPIAKTLSEYTNLPIIVKANAGLPDGQTYDIKAEDFAKATEEFLKTGASIFGGCCGTNPDYIKKIKEMLAEKTMIERPQVQNEFLCSDREVIEEAADLTVGQFAEKIEGDKLVDALLDDDVDTVYDIIFDFSDDEVQLIHIDFDKCAIKSAETAVKLVQTIQEVGTIPLHLTGSDPSIVCAAKRVYKGKC